MVDGLGISLSNLTDYFPPTMTSFIKNSLIFLGTISVIYLAYLIISLVISIKRAKTLRRMEGKIDKIYDKLMIKKK